MSIVEYIDSSPNEIVHDSERYSNIESLTFLKILKLDTCKIRLQKFVDSGGVIESRLYVYVYEKKMCFVQKILKVSQLLPKY